MLTMCLLLFPDLYYGNGNVDSLPRENGMPSESPPKQPFILSRIRNDMIKGLETIFYK